MKFSLPLGLASIAAFPAYADNLARKNSAVEEYPRAAECALPRVSLLIISYNQQDYIGEAISSAVAQDYDNLEIIVSDDGSTDDTPSIITEWARRYPSKIIPLLNQQNCGITKNCNRALEESTGEYISLLGGDDVLLTTKISRQVAWFLSKPDAVLCGHRIKELKRGSKMTPSPTIGEGVGPKRFILDGMQLEGSSLMVRAAAVPASGFDEAIPMASDRMFCIDVLANGGSYGYVDEILALYRIHPGNISKNLERMSRDVESTFRVIAARYPQYRCECESLITRHSFYYYGVRYLLLGDTTNAKQKLYETIRRDPLYLKAWIRLAQTYWKQVGFGS
jgi:glycosyltransferase involved in cell wall biosynthesis